MAGATCLDMGKQNACGRVQSQRLGGNSNDKKQDRGLLSEEYHVMDSGVVGGRRSSALVFVVQPPLSSRRLALLNISSPALTSVQTLMFGRFPLSLFHTLSALLVASRSPTSDPFFRCQDGYKGQAHG